MSNKKPIIFILICTIFTSIGQIFLKIGADNLEISFFGLISNIYLVLGLVFYITGLIFMISAMRNGDLSFLYPFIALSLVWVLLLSHFFLGEEINKIKIAAVIFILAGVSLISASGVKNG